MKLLVTIVDRENSEEYIELLNHDKPRFQVVSLGHGTANSEILDYFGLAETDKTLILAIVEDGDVKALFEELAKKESIHRHGGAVAFTVSIANMNKKFFDLIKTITNIQLEDKHE
jgi:uncharacterized protein YfbU (UPF0304 family)